MLGALCLNLLEALAVIILCGFALIAIVFVIAVCSLIIKELAKACKKGDNSDVRK